MMPYNKANQVTHFWTGLMKVKCILFHYGIFNIKDGSEIRFWEDNWLDNSPLKVQYPSLYNIAYQKQDSVAKVLESFPVNISFRKNLSGSKLVAWNELMACLNDIALLNARDEFRWTLNQSGKFSVKSLYRALMQGDESS